MQDSSLRRVQPPNMYELRARPSLTSRLGTQRSALTGCPQPSSVPAALAASQVGGGRSTPLPSSSTTVGSHHALSLSGAAQQYHKRLSATEVPVSTGHAALGNHHAQSPSASEHHHHSSSNNSGAASSIYRTADMPLSASSPSQPGASSSARRRSATATPLTPLLESILRRSSVAADAGHALPSNSRFAAVLRHTVGGMTALNENRVGFSPTTDAALEVASVLSGRRASGQVGTAGSQPRPLHPNSLASSSSATAGADCVRESTNGRTIRIRAKPGDGPMPQRPSINPVLLSASSRSRETGLLNCAGVSASGISAAAGSLSGVGLPTRADDDASVGDEVNRSTGSDIGDGGALDDLPSASLSWSKLQREMAMQVVAKQESRMYVQADPGAGAADGSVKDGAMMCPLSKRQVLVKKPVLIRDSFVDEDIESSDGEDM